VRLDDSFLNLFERCGRFPHAADSELGHFELHTKEP